jgi:2-alkyl-3-oxoalkanoate reductase
MRALVTGGGGFLGLAIVKKLRARGDEVTTVARGAYPELASLGVHHIQGDIADASTMLSATRKQDVVFHVAAKAGVWGNADDYEHANVTGTQNVLDACVVNHVTRLVYTSSPSVTFDGTDANNANETLPYPSKHLHHYGRTKAEAERRVLQANATPHRKLSTVLLTTSLRPHLIYGPGDPHILPRMIDRHRQGRLRIVGDGNNRVDVTYVDNAAHAHLLAADVLAHNKPRCAGKMYFVSDGVPVVPWQWLNTLFAGAGLPPLTKSVSYGTAKTVGALCEAAWTTFRLSGEPPMTRLVAAQLGTSHYYNLAKVKADIGYEPVVDVKTATDRTIAWLRSRSAVSTAHKLG